MKNDFEIRDGVLYIREGVTELADQQFAERSDFQKVIIPESLRIMGTEVFSCCGELREVILPESFKFISIAAFAYCPSLTNLTLPKGLKSVGEGAFLECAAYRDYTLPEGLENICDMAFWGTDIERISIPASVERIGDSAFWACENLRHADVLGRDTEICSDAFGSCFSLSEGYIAPGYPNENSPAAELLYTLLWCTCPEKHTAAVSDRAKRFIAAEEGLIMERIFKTDSIAALSALAKMQLLNPGNIDTYLRKANSEGRTQMAALLLVAKGAARHDEGEFDL